MKIKQSVCLPMLKPDNIPLKEYLVEISEMGYQAVEIWARDEYFEEVMSLTKTQGLVMSSMIGHGSIANGLNDLSQHDRIEIELRESIDLAAKHKIPGIICFSGNHVPGQSEETAIDNSVNGFKRIADYRVFGI